VIRSRLIALVVFFLPVPVGAQGLGLLGGGGGGPIEIEAEEGIEWLREQSQYVAKGKARVARDGVELRAETITAFYRDGAEGNSEIWRIEAEGGVVIASAAERAQGDRGIYEVDKGVIVLTGRALKLTTATDVITARDSLEYWETEQLAVARGRARAAREDSLVTAEVLRARFRDDGQGGLSISRVEAFENTCIQDANNVARGRQGDYNVQTGIALLRQQVRISQGGNVLKGDLAEVNMNTGVSRLLTDRAGGPRRVTGLVLPGGGGDDAQAAPKPPAIPPCQ